jgi:hypothetical protein
MVGEGAGRGRPRRHLDAHHVLEDTTGQADIGDAPGRIDEIAAQGLEHEVEGEDGEGADRQHPEGRDRVVGHDAVVDVHHEERRGEGEGVDQDGGDQDLGIGRPLAVEGRPEPVALAFEGDRPVALLVADLRPSEEGMTVIAALELGQLHAGGAAPGLRHDDLQDAAVAAGQDDATPVFQEQNAGQRQGVDLGDRASHQPRAQSGPLEGAWRQGRHHAAFGQRQARYQRLHRGRPAVQLGQSLERAEQRIVMCLGTFADAPGFGLELGAARRRRVALGGPAGERRPFFLAVAEQHTAVAHRHLHHSPRTCPTTIDDSRSVADRANRAPLGATVSTAAKALSAAAAATLNVMA